MTETTLSPELEADRFGGFERSSRIRGNRTQGSRPRTRCPGRCT